MTTARQTLVGIGVGTGVATGPVAQLSPPPELPADSGPEADVDGATARAHRALESVATTLEDRAGGSVGDAADVLLAEAMIVRDPALSSEIAAGLSAGRSLPHAVSGAFDRFREQLLAAGGYLAGRAADLDDLCHHTLAVLLDEPMPGIPDRGHPIVLAATDLAPADTAVLDPATIRAIVTEQGGPTSHTAIIAKSLGIPAVVACPGSSDLAEDTAVLVDGATGTVTPDPTSELVAARTARADAAARAAAEITGRGHTADGTSIELLVNLGAERELQAAATADAEGVGLLRTEFLFLDRSDEPSQDEQRASYARIFAAFSGRKVVVRTLDAGADKPLGFIDHGIEQNPALGMRGLRLVRRHPELLETQLAAIAGARTETSPDIWVMAPMVATAAEAHEFTARAHAHDLSVAGVMVEVPAAALRAEAVLAECGFVSIGTNDLGQYTMAADRLTAELAGLLDSWQPALLELVRRTGDAGAATGKPVGICGEAAGDPLLAPVLVGLGATSLSMAPSALPEVRAALATRTLADCRRLAELALASPDAASARAAVADTAP